MNIKNERLFRFPAKTRLIICKRIYQHLVLNHTKEQILEYLILGIEKQISWTTEIPDNERNHLNRKIRDSKYKKLIINYFSDLIEIVSEIINISQLSEILNVREFSEKLIKLGLNINLKIDPLRFFIKDLIEFLKIKFKDFNIERISKQVLYYNEKCKECARCHKIKLHSKFLKRKGGSLESMCKKCKQEVNAIRRELNKLNIIKEIYEGTLLRRCQRCNSDISRLPALDFHHPTSYKTIEWSKLRHSNYKYALKMLEKDKVLLLCVNCHSKEQTSSFNLFEDIILKTDLFEYSSEEIRSLILNTVKEKYPEKTSESRSKIKYNVILWIKKRYIIERLYNGKCIGCGEITVFNNLPSLVFHHLESNEYKGSIWRRIQTKKVKEIASILKKEKCVCLCSNCHRLLHAPYFISDIIYFLENDEKIKATSFYNQLIRNVKNFYFKDEIIEDPLKLKFEYGEKWKKYLVEIYKYCQNKCDYHFNSLELENVFEIGAPAINKNLRKLLNRNFIQLINEKSPLRKGKLIIGQIPRLYRLTDLGIKAAQKFL